MVFFEPMNPPIAPSSPELTKFYRERYNWRNAGEERMRFRKHMQLAQVRPGSSVLDIGSRNGDLRKYLPRDVKYQGLDIAPEFAAPDILRSEEHTSELQSQSNLVCRLLLEKK